MAYKVRSQNEPTGTKEIRGQQGTTSKAEKLPAKSQNKGRRRSWEIEVIVKNEEPFRLSIIRWRDFPQKNVRRLGVSPWVRFWQVWHVDCHKKRNRPMET